MTTCRRCKLRGLVKEECPERSYSVPGLPVILHHSEVVCCPSCGYCDDTLPDLDGLRGAIAQAVAAKRGRLTPAEIRFLRRRLGWSGLEMAIHMGSTPETVSRWENGRTPMGTTADRLLRALVALRAGGAGFSFGRFRMVARGEPRATRIDVEFRAGQWRPLPQ